MQGPCNKLPTIQPPAMPKSISICAQVMAPHIRGVPNSFAWPIKGPFNRLQRIQPHSAAGTAWNQLRPKPYFSYEITASLWMVLNRLSASVESGEIQRRYGLVQCRNWSMWSQMARKADQIHSTLLLGMLESNKPAFYECDHFRVSFLPDGELLLTVRPGNVACFFKS